MHPEGHLEDFWIFDTLTILWSKVCQNRQIVDFPMFLGRSEAIKRPLESYLRNNDFPKYFSHGSLNYFHCFVHS